jgi:GT2 family glycosyltransferase
LNAWEAPLADIGFVAIGRNEGERLKRCLRSIPAGATMVYVDSGSTDDSLAFAAQHGAHVVELDLSRPFTAARARNEGFERLLEENSHVRFVQFVDGDCELETGWVQRGLEALTANSDLAVVCGRRRERFKQSSRYNSWMDEEWDTPVGPALACGGDALVRASAFRQVGGYDAAIVAGEEPELCARLRSHGWAIWRLDASMTIHDADMHRFSQWWVRAVRSGYGYVQVFRKTCRGPSNPLYCRELARSLGWTVGVVFLALVLVPLVGAAALLLAPAIWALQLLRLSLSYGPSKGIHLLLAKAAEATGVLRYCVAMARGIERGTIFYK